MIEANERINQKHACFVDVALIGSKEDRNFITYYIAFAINFVFFFLIIGEYYIGRIIESTVYRAREHLLCF